MHAMQRRRPRKVMARYFPGRAQEPEIRQACVIGRCVKETRKPRSFAWNIRSPPQTPSTAAIFQDRLRSIIRRSPAYSPAPPARRCHPPAKTPSMVVTHARHREDRAVPSTRCPYPTRAVAYCITTSLLLGRGKPDRLGGTKSDVEIGHGQLAWARYPSVLPPAPRIPLHAAPCFRDHRVELISVDGFRLRRLRWRWNGCRRPT